MFNFVFSRSGVGNILFKEIFLNLKLPAEAEKPMLGAHDAIILRERHIVFSNKAVLNLISKTFSPKIINLNCTTICTVDFCECCLHKNNRILLRTGINYELLRITN